MESSILQRLIDHPASWEEASLQVFHFQLAQNSVYHSFVHALRKNAAEISKFSDIPFLPVEFFKQHNIICQGVRPETVFSSSTTSGGQPSLHPVARLSLYEESFLKGFRYFYGDPSGYRILALLPSYLERTGSSLVYMMDKLIRLSGHRESGFYLHNHNELAATLTELEKRGEKSILLGVSFALLDFAESHPMPLKSTILMETGGMKGRREEITREELHAELKKAFGLDNIHSEYGMTELLSQGYSAGKGIFRSPPWMKILIRDPYDPFHYLPVKQAGAVNIIDLANYWSCSFLATSDLGRVLPDGSFEILGRLDQSEIRGCNLMVN